MKMRTHIPTIICVCYICTEAFSLQPEGLEDSSIVHRTMWIQAAKLSADRCVRLFIMGQSLVNNYLHITFSTKDRYPFIDDDIEQKLFTYLGGICNNYQSKPLKVGGHKDHIHILCALSQKIALAQLIEELKKSSSKWMKTQGDKYEAFYWQEGYGAFSVNPTEIDLVSDYIANQHTRHQTKTFAEEFEGFLKKYGTKYDNRYLWK